MNRRILIVALVQLLLLCGMVGAKQYTLNTGEQILLETQPIDPRSLFRGDYVRLNYTINSLALEELVGDDIFAQHDTVWVVLRKDGEYHQPVSAHNRKPDTGHVVIKGTVRNANVSRWNAETQSTEPFLRLDVKYGIENYFVPEGTGRELELRWRDDEEKRVDIRVAVDSAGKSGIKAVLVNGEARYVETLL